MSWTLSLLSYLWDFIQASWRRCEMWVSRYSKKLKVVHGKGFLARCWQILTGLIFKALDTASCHLLGKAITRIKHRLPSICLSKRFFVFAAGQRNTAHHDFVEKLKGVGHAQVTSPEECDFLLVFCPVASRVGTDIDEALNKMPAGNRTVLVVMHHTFDPHAVVAESRRLVTNPHVTVTVDCLFHEQRFLSCVRNSAAWEEVEACFAGPIQKDTR